MKNNTTERLIGSTVEVNAAAMDAGSGLKTIFLSPMGEVDSTNEPFILDEEGVESIQRALAAHGLPVPIDYEHQGLTGYAAANGPVPAAGWISKVWSEGGALYGLVKWNARARELIQADEYRYLSPVFNTELPTKGGSLRRAVGFHSAALTNKPAIRGMRRVAAKETDEPMNEPSAMMFDKLRKALSLADDADPAAVLEAALAALQKGGPETIANAADGPTIATLREQIAHLEAQRAEDAARDLVAHAVSTRRVSALDTDRVAYIAERAKADLDDARRMVELMPQSVPPAGRLTPATPGPGTSRQTIIVNAAAAFHADDVLGKLTTCKAFVSERLRAEKQAPLTDEEARTLATA